MKLIRVFLVCLLVLTAVGAGFADAKPSKGKGKAAFTPKVGDYKGTATTGGKAQPATAKVGKAGGKVGVLITLPTTLTCSDGTSVADTLTFNVEVKKNAFSESGVGSGHNTYKLSGKFTSATKLSGTASKEGPLDDHVNGSPTCSTGKVSFSLTKK